MKWPTIAVLGRLVLAWSLGDALPIGVVCADRGAVTRANLIPFLDAHLPLLLNGESMLVWWWWWYAVNGRLRCQTQPLQNRCER